MTSQVSPVRVVAAILVEDGKALVTQRLADQTFPLQWEFPGGKVEVGESGAQALVREMQEEVGITVEVEDGPPFGAIRYVNPSGREVEVSFHRARRTGGEPEPIEVADVRWVGTGELDVIAFIPHNREIVRRLREELET
jgi:8-oxo-dGTP diphosphatase